MFSEILKALPLTTFHLFLSIIMIITINSFGSIRRGYVNIDQLLSSTNLGYNLSYRILFPTVFISFITLILYKIGFGNLTINIWQVSVYFWLINLLTLILMRRFALINKLLYVIIHVSSILITYWVYETALKYGPNSILPDAGNFRTEWWFIILAYFYSLFNDFTPDYQVEYERKRKFTKDRFKALSKQYNSLLKKDFKTNKFLKLVFYSIMITEDINRPPFVRFIEKLLHPFGIIKTTGIMQVTSKKLLNDTESIYKAQEIILKSYQKHRSTTDEYQLVNKIAGDYNSGGYGFNVNQYYSELKQVLS